MLDRYDQKNGKLCLIAGTIRRFCLIRWARDMLIDHKKTCGYVEACDLSVLYRAYSICSVLIRAINLMNKSYGSANTVCNSIQQSMDERTLKTPNPKCRLFFKIDLLTDFAALCLTDFIDWRYIHLGLVFSTQLVYCCPHGRRNNTCVLLPLYLLSDLPPPFSNYMYSIYGQCVAGGGWCWIVL